MISQYLSAVLILIHMVRLQDSCRVGKRLRLHGGEAGRILGLGIPAGIQHMIFAVANLFIQVGINSFDSTVVSGNSAAVNVDNVIYNVMAAFYTACSTFMGQNWGAGNKDRMMKSYYISLGYSFLIAAVLGVGFLLCGEPFLSISSRTTRTSWPRAWSGCRSCASPTVSARSWTAPSPPAAASAAASCRPSL